jgi:two-component system, OmpR family, KDP operon response regulator KdpE
MRTNKRVLVVDDEPGILKVVEIQLRLNGYGSITTTSGAEAIRLVREQKPDLVLLDVLMPDVTGLDVLDSVRTFSNVPVIIFSADQSVINMAATLGASGSVPKPFKPDDLMRKIKSFLE